MQPLRVLHVTPYGGSAWAYGGIPRLSDVMVRGLAARGHQVTVCTTDACEADRRLTPVRGLRSLAPWPPSRLDRDVELRVFPNVSNWLAYRQCLSADRPLRIPQAAEQGIRRRASARLPKPPWRHRRPPPEGTRVPYVVAPNGTAPNLERRRAAKRRSTRSSASVMDGAATGACDDARRAASAHASRDSGGTHRCRAEPAGARGVRPAPLPGTVPRAIGTSMAPSSPTWGS